MLDYKGAKEYPEPDKRILKADFPSVDELYRYGEEVSVPESVEDLRCKYTEKEPTPLLKLEELRGYCVPPLGIVTVAVNGMGLRAGKAGWIYKPGTFRENRHTIDKELGVTQSELIASAADARKESILAGVTRALEDAEEYGITLDMSGKNTDMGTLDAFAEVVTRKVLKEASARESISWFKLIDGVISNKDEIIDRHRNDMAKQMASYSMKMLDEALNITKEAIAMKRGDVIELDFEGEQAE